MLEHNPPCCKKLLHYQCLTRGCVCVRQCVRVLTRMVNPKEVTFLKMLLVY